MHGYTYSDKALNQLVEMYQGIEVNIDHPSRDNPAAERSVLDGFGVLENARLGTDGVYADLRYFDKHQSTPLILERAEDHPNTFGCSHTAGGDLVGSGDEMCVESMDIVHSVDLVGRPATNKGLFESQEEGTMKTTLRELFTKASPKHATALIEMMDGLADVGAEIELAAEDETNPAEAVGEALAKEATKLFLAPKISPKDTGKQIAELAKVVEDVKAKVAPGAGEEAATEEAVGDPEEKKPDEVTESISSKKMNDIIKRLNRADAKNMLMEAGVEATDTRVDAVAWAQEAKRQKLVESWPAQGGTVEHPRPASSRPLTESVEDSDFSRDPQKFAESLR